jgi:hypothetical protein
MTLMEAGRGDSEIAVMIGVPRETISGWRHGRGSAYHRRRAASSHDWRPRAATAYAYLLGVYLGDGSLAVSARGSAALIISLDARYPTLMAEIESALRSLFLDTRIARVAGEGNAAIIRLSHPALPFAFPQHGPGRKHNRPIVLLGWQQALTGAHPRELLRGLIHSDGCRTINRFTTKLPSGRVAEYEYPRYFFSNLSADIRRIFCDHCDLLGIRWTQSNPRNISISHRDSVARLDQFVGPKS